jgi:homoserine dehydrogenase
MSTQLNIGLFGFGVVGEGLFNVLNESKIKNASISKIVVKDKEKARSIGRSYFSYDKNEILQNDEINLVVELINDSEAAYEIVTTALRNKKSVVSANKKLIAEHLDELINLAIQNDVSFLYEAAVGGAIPVLRNLEEYYNNDLLNSVEGIINGTTNYILTQLSKGGTYPDALKKAQDLGFAESNPTLDVDGFDAKYKLVILLKHAFGVTADHRKIQQIGVRNIKAQDAAYAKEKGYRIKLVARAERIEDGVLGYVAPHFVNANNLLYNVNDEFNGIVVEGAFADRQLFYGKGAGSYPTASAVLSDISAIKYDYKYEYKKTDDNETKLSDSFFVKVYIGSEFVELINEIPFFRVDEVFQSEGYTYQIGWVDFAELRQFQFNSISDLSIIFLSEPIIHKVSANKIKVQKKLHQVEF